MLITMADSYEPEPYENVEVNFSNPDYRNVCDTFGGGFERLDDWIALANILAGRPGWHFDIVNDGQALWSLGDFGGSNLNISVTEDGFNCYNHSSDDSVVLKNIDLVSSWIEPLEEEGRRFPIQLAASSNWQVLLSLKFRIRVDVIGDKYCADVKGMAEEEVFGDTLVEVVAFARERIVQYFEAPVELTEKLLIRLDISEKATQRLMRGA